MVFITTWTITNYFIHASTNKTTNVGFIGFLKFLYMQDFSIVITQLPRGGKVIINYFKYKDICKLNFESKLDRNASDVW